MQKYLGQVLSSTMRKSVAETGIRLDGRKTDEQIFGLKLE